MIPSRIFICLLCIIVVSSGFAEEDGMSSVIREVEALQRAYPDVLFTYSYNKTVGDFELTIQQDGDTAVLYRADGRYLTKDQLSNKEKYWQLLYLFPDSLADPADFTDEELDRITRFGSTENRRTGRIAGTALFDALYDCQTQESVEQHIVSVDFLGHSIRVHKKITGQLDRMENKIRSAAVGDPSIELFLHELGTLSGYFWRSVRDTSGKSFHSMGLAVDIMPENLGGKAIYWNWEKNKGNDRWMLIPLADRWMPPEKVIRIFESEGFTWGGMWPIWDNMHFEYRPELLEWRDRN